MDFELSDEQRLLKDSVERLTTQRYDFEARRKFMAEPDGWSRALWKQYVDLGLTALPFAEEHGGIGGGAVETMIVMEAFGRALALEPYFATVVLGGSFLRLGASEATRAEVLPNVAAGETLLSFAHVERQSRYVLLVRLPTKAAPAVAQALARHVRRLPQTLRRSLTWDRGRELAAHRAFTIATDVQVYFCDPHSPWQRGSNENTNGLLRQYFPRGTDLSAISQAQLNRVAHELNQRPRKTLGWRTPADMLATIVASTA